SLLCASSVAHTDAHSFPTRRSSDLSGLDGNDCRSIAPRSAMSRHLSPPCALCRQLEALKSLSHRMYVRVPAQKQRNDFRHPNLRSEEHTSELQSRENLVCRLLLEKK